MDTRRAGLLKRNTILCWISTVKVLVVICNMRKRFKYRVWLSPVAYIQKQGML